MGPSISCVPGKNSNHWAISPVQLVHLLTEPGQPQRTEPELNEMTHVRTSPSLPVLEIERDLLKNACYLQASFSPRQGWSCCSTPEDAILICCCRVDHSDQKKAEENPYFQMTFKSLVGKTSPATCCVLLWLLNLLYLQSKEFLLPSITKHQTVIWGTSFMRTWYCILDLLIPPSGKSSD